MTRKRLNVEPVEAPPAPEKKKFFPSKRGGHANENEAENFQKKYGYVGERNSQTEGNNLDQNEILENKFQNWEHSNAADDLSNSVFPTEITSYLRGINELLESGEESRPELFETVLKQCVGSEVVLLSFKDSASVVEKVFGSKPQAATLFLEAIVNQKHRVIVDLMFGGCSARTLENLLYASAPITQSSVDIVSKFVELFCDNWNDAITTQPSVYLLRCICRLTCGLGPIENTPKFGVAKRAKPKFYNATTRTALQRLFSQIADRILDVKTVTPHWDKLFCSVLLQSFFEADAAVNGNRSDLFIENVLANLDENEIIEKLQGKDSSRIWDSAFTFCTDHGVKIFWDKIASKHFKALVYHPIANFSIQRLLSAQKTEETAVAVCKDVIPLISTLLAEKKQGVVTHLLKSCCSHPALEELALKELRKHFNAEKASSKEHFFFNIMTMNPKNGPKRDLSNFQYHGSMLLQELFKFTKVKTLSANIMDLPDELVYKMAIDKTASHTIQCVLKSDSVGDDVKTKIIQALEKKSVELISSPIGSHVFECMWDSPLLKVAQKQNLMKSFVPIRNDSKFWKFAMLRCDMNLFRSDRKGWVKKQKAWKTFEKTN